MEYKKPIIYECDPEKHINCRKTECYKHGGECKHTHHSEYRKTFECLIQDCSKDSCDNCYCYCCSFCKNHDDCDLLDFYRCNSPEGR